MSTTSRLLRSDADTAGATRTYLYGVVRRADVRAIRNEGVAGAGIVSIDHGEIAALTSAIPGTGEIRARRRDLLRHSDVVQEAFAAGPVVPLRFGTVAASASSVVDDLLAPRHDELLDLLEAFDGLAELSVRAFYREEEVLGELVREKGIFSLEEMVHQFTEVPARLYGLRDRGRIQVGCWADIVMFDPAKVDAGPLRTVRDLPAGAPRLVTESVGVHYVLVGAM